MAQSAEITATWTLSANGRVYGPYTPAQMRAFAAEGRLAPHSLVARAGETRFRPAVEDAELAPLFRAAAQSQHTQPSPQRPVFFTAEGDIGAQNFGRHTEEARGTRLHYVIIADMKSRSIAGLEQEIFNLGPAYPILPQAWLLTSDMSINAIRNVLVQKLGKLDMLFIIDASRDKAAWFNYGPEADSRIRRIWQKPHEQRAAG